MYITTSVSLLSSPTASLIYLLSSVISINGHGICFLDGRKLSLSAEIPLVVTQKHLIFHGFHIFTINKADFMIIL